MEVFQAQLPLINECKQHLARHESRCTLSMANRITYNQGEATPTSFFEPLIPVKEIIRKKETRQVLEVVT